MADPTAWNENNHPQKMKKDWTASCGDDILVKRRDAFSTDWNFLFVLCDTKMRNKSVQK